MRKKYSLESHNDVNAAKKHCNKELQTERHFTLFLSAPFSILISIFITETVCVGCSVVKKNRFSIHVVRGGNRSERAAPLGIA